MIIEEDIEANSRAEHNCYFDGVTGDGPIPADVLGIGIAPGRNEWKRTRKPFTGPSGVLLNGTLAATGYSRDKIFMTNVHCQWNDSPTEEEIELCWPRLQDEIERVNPALIVTFGTIASDAFLKGKLGIKYRRGRLYRKDGRWYLPTYHPSAFLRDKGDKFKGPDIADFARDIAKIATVSLWRDREPPNPEIVVADSVEEAEAILWSLQGLTAIDIETSYNGLEFAYPDVDLVGNEESKLLCFAVSNDRGTWVIPGKFIGKVRKGWGQRDAVSWIMHLGMFDRAQFWRLAGEDIRYDEDSLYESYSLDERGGANEENDRAVGVHGLKLLSAEYLGAEEYDVNVLKAGYDELHHYNGKDAYYTRNLHPIFKARQEADGVREMYENILMPSARVLSDIQARGVHVDLDVMYDFGYNWSKQWLELYETLMDESVKLGWKDGELNFKSNPQMNTFLFDILGAKPHPIFGRSRRKEVMEELAKDIPWCGVYQEWNAVDHMLNSYIVGVEDDIKFDKRLHPQPVLHGTRSGRLSYHKPPVQTIPKWGVDPALAKIRSMFDASSDEYCIVEADLRQAELWATAYLSGDLTMLNELQTGDAHGITAKVSFDIDESHINWKPYREIGKLFNFGTLYNRTAEGYAKNPFQGRKPPPGLEEWKPTKVQAQKIINGIFKRWPDVKEWQKKEIRNVFRDGEQVSIVGRKRRYWLPDYKSVNQGVNFQPQSMAHEFLLDSLRKLHYALAEFDSYILFEVHDALLIEVKKKYLDTVLKLIKRIMTEPKFGYEGIPCDIAVGSNWYNVEKVEV